MRPQFDDLLLPGGDPVHVQEGDVAMWIAVYEELLAGHCLILEELRSNGGSEQIELRIQRLELGLAFWRRQLQPSDSTQDLVRSRPFSAASITAIVTARS